MIRHVAPMTARPVRGCGICRSGRALPIVVVLLIAVLIVIALYVINRDAGTLGDAGGVATDQTESPAESSEALPAVSGDGELFDGWSEPAAVLVFSGQQHGYLEPCGCTAGQVGGLARRTDLVRMLRDDKQWPVAAFDNGGVMRDERAKRPQEALKLATTRRAMRLMEYDAQGIGTEELRLGATGLFELFSQEQGEGDTAPPFVCANLTLFEERTDDYSIGTPEQFRIAEVGGLKVAVTAVAGDDAWMSVFPGGLEITDTLFGFEPPAAALKRVIPLMQAEQPDVMVLLAHSHLDGSRDLAAQFPVFDIVLTAGGPEDGRREPGMVGETLVLEVGQKGKAVGVVGVFPHADDQKLRFQLVELNGKDFKHDRRMHALFEQYVETLNSRHPELQENLGPHPSGAEYVGAEACQKCHADAYEVWEGSMHAHAFESLTTGRPDDADDDILIVRTHDPECITCHATGWDPLLFGRYDSAFVDMESTPKLAGSQCENCHGPGSKHVALEEEFEKEGGDPGPSVLRTRFDMQVTLKAARENLCVQCHDLDNSPHFDTDDRPFDDWWAEIEH